MDLKYFKFIKDEKFNVAGITNLVVKIKADSEEFIPSFQTEQAAGADLRSTIDTVLVPLQVAMIDVGFCAEIPRGYHAKIVARSSMGKKGIIVPNAPGIIDSDYRNRICVLLLNLTSENFEIKKYDRIAQWIIEPNIQYCWSKTDELGTTERGMGGFGSTGK